MWQLIQKRPALRAYDGKQVIAGIRPEDFEDAALVDGTPADGALTSQVQLVESLGSEVMVHFDIDARTVD